MTAIKQIGMGGLLVFSVGLLTLLFSFLGTITCSAIVGMMLGSTRRWNWPMLLVSLVFPAVIVGFAQFTKADLSLQQSNLVALLCFGVFWMTYLSTFALVHYEKRNKQLQEESAGGAATPAAQVDRNGWTPISSDEPVGHSAEPVPTGPFTEPGLEEIQGTWSCDETFVNGRPCSKRIQIVRNRMTLTLVDTGHHTQSVYTAKLQSARWGPFKVLQILGWKAAQPDGSASPQDGSITWIYRVSERTLRVAVHFEETAGGHEPRMETFFQDASPDSGFRAHR